MAIDAGVGVKRRAGGRAARRELRSRDLPESERPVRPGIDRGGRFKPLSDVDIGRIHAAVLDALEQIGMANPIPSCVEHLTRAGARVNESGRIVFPRALVEDTIAGAAKNVELYGQDPTHDMQVGGHRVYFGTAGAAVHMVDAVTGVYRESTLADLYDAARLVDSLEHIHFFQRPVVCRDLVDPRELDLNTCYASISGTAKHVGTSFVDPVHAEEALAMLHLVAGGEAAWRARPFVSCSS
ncbi:MAG: methyltransferase, partial [Proteobacteria bacterium]